MAAVWVPISRTVLSPWNTDPWAHHGRAFGDLEAGDSRTVPTVDAKFRFVPANDLDAMRAAFEATDSGPVASVIMELIQGEAGVLPLDPEFVRGVRSLCDEHHAKLIVDEVQTGMGRTGKWFAFQRDDLGGITPDMVTFAKGVAGGFPMGGMIAFGEELSNLFSPGTHGPPSRAIRWGQLPDWRRSV